MRGASRLKPWPRHQFNSTHMNQYKSTVTPTEFEDADKGEQLEMTTRDQLAREGKSQPKARDRQGGECFTHIPLAPGQNIRVIAGETAIDVTVSEDDPSRIELTPAGNGRATLDGHQLNGRVLSICSHG